MTVPAIVHYREMKASNLGVFVAAAFCCACSAGKPIDYVNVFNGTDFHGHTYPGATTPSALVQLSPDTRTYGWDGCSGYHYSDTSILGFSHTHLSGTGCPDLGDIMFTPGLDEVKPLRFSHKDEKARPGYYRVSTPGITVELTATPRSGVQRYTFRGKGARVVLIDATHRIGDGSRLVDAFLKPVGTQEVEGGHVIDGWVKGRGCYFSTVFSSPFDKVGEVEPGKLLLTFPSDLKELTVLTGISFSGVDGARANRLAECEGKDFESVLSDASAAWSEALSAIKVDGGPKEQFYTCLYHTMVCPNRIDDTGSERPFYSTLSLWDTFRSWNPLQTLIHPDLVNDMVNSMLEMYRRWGELPIWPLAYGETGCMIGYHSIPVIADAWLHGIRGFDGNEALDAMVVSSNKNKGEASVLYNRYGYIPADRMGQSVSQTLEMAYDDWCIARMAESLGRNDVAAEYDSRALYYRNVFDPSTGFMRGKNEDGSWVEPFDPVSNTREYTEAIPWQARFFVPHDVAGHTGLMGGTPAALAALDSLFTYEGRSLTETFPDITGLLGQYAHGNEPSHHMAYLFNWLGAPWKSQEVVRTLLTEMYGTAPDGVCGNEDCGQMSAWYVLSSLGLYPACPGSGEYILAAPMFKKATLALGSGNTLVITADHPEYPYISGVSLNGVTVQRNYLTFDEIMGGGVLSFTLSKEPDHGRDSLPAPYSLSTSEAVSTPVISGGFPVFIDSTGITISTRTEGASIHYTLDGSEPTENSPLYTGPFTLEKSALIRARAFKDGAIASPEARAEAEKGFFRPASKVSGLVNGCRYTYHTGHFARTADVGASPVKGSGIMEVPSVKDAPEKDYFGYVFTGWIDVPEDGIWEFSLRSDDGSVLDVDGTRVVDNDGVHPDVTVLGRIPLRKGLHPYRLVFYEGAVNELLDWAWRPQGQASFEPVSPGRLYCAPEK